MKLWKMIRMQCHTHAGCTSSPQNDASGLTLTWSVKMVTTPPQRAVFFGSEVSVVQVTRQRATRYPLLGKPHVSLSGICIWSEWDLHKIEYHCVDKEKVPTLELHTGINSFHFNLDPSGGKDWHGKLKLYHTVAHQTLLPSPSMLGTMQLARHSLGNMWGVSAPKRLELMYRWEVPC